MRVITAGILGAGRIGKIHANNLMAMAGVRLKAIADPFVDFKEWPGAAIVTSSDPEAVLNDGEIEAVLVCSPTPSHAEFTEAAARAGKHVFCEKPIALDPERVRATLGVVERSGVKLQVGFNRRFDPTFARVRRAVVDGEIGDVHLVRITARDPAPPPAEYVQASGGMFVDMTIHDFDMVRFLSGSEVEEVHAYGAVLVDPAIGRAGDIDTAVTTLRLSNGALAIIENSRQAVFGYDQRIEVFGSKGGIEAYNETPAQTVLRTGAGVRSENPLYFFLERYQRSFVIELEAFFSSIREDTQPPAGGEDGLMALLVGLAAKQSLLENRPVQVGKLASPGSKKAG
jgi:myo-inositol 2-dehydrogenase / D-chiro-inositol 1-dehydrogenase